PLLVRYWPRYTLLERARHRVLPGMTGWAQVNGRNAITWSRRFELDLWYVRNWSFALDLRILWLTASAVLSRRDVERSESVVMPEFMGTDAGSHPEPAGSDGRQPNQPGA
ncbi:MAG: sugar transferase, partial [Candidatus Wallbacteria bacterium]|nr:sugar transferase [Candidatus Wallbacteria bacterium]